MYNSRGFLDASLNQHSAPLILAQLPVPLRADRLHEHLLHLLLPLLLVGLLVHEEPTHVDHCEKVRGSEVHDGVLRNNC